MHARTPSNLPSLLSKRLREAPPARSPARFVGRFGIGAKGSAEATPREPPGAIVGPFLGPR
eukprot:15434750-Alexandrium_andersonii.AAC.1